MKSIAELPLQEGSVFTGYSHDKMMALLDAGIILMIYREPLLNDEARKKFITEAFEKRKVYYSSKDKFVSLQQLSAVYNDCYEWQAIYLASRFLRHCYRRHSK